MFGSPPSSIRIQSRILQCIKQSCFLCLLQSVMVSHSLSFLSWHLWRELVSCFVGFPSNRVCLMLSHYWIGVMDSEKNITELMCSSHYFISGHIWHQLDLFFVMLTWLSQLRYCLPSFFTGKWLFFPFYIFNRRKSLNLAHTQREKHERPWRGKCSRICGIIAKPSR